MADIDGQPVNTLTAVFIPSGGGGGARARPRARPAWPPAGPDGINTAVARRISQSVASRRGVNFVQSV